MKSMPSDLILFVDTNVLLTEDLQYEQRFDDDQTINPFKSGIELLEQPK